MKNRKLILSTVITLLIGVLGGYAIARTQNSIGAPVIHSEEEHSHSEEDNASHGHEMFVVGPEEAPTVNLEVTEDAKSGWNVKVITSNFTFTPQNVNGENVVGEGHAHLYVDGEKISRLYSNNFHYDENFDGTKTFRVTLNANDHSEYAVGEEVIAAEQTVTHEAHE